MVAVLKGLLWNWGGGCKSGELADELMGAAPSEVDGEAVGSLLGDRLVEGELGMA